MTKYLSIGLFFLAFFSYQLISAQFVERFEDGDFTVNPNWNGDENVFIVNASEELQLSDLNVLQSESYLSVGASTGMEANWTFKTRLDFSPSGSNFSRIYLNANQQDLTQSLNGYFIQIGGISGDQDAVELVRQDGSTLTTLISGTPGAAATSTVEVNVIVDRDANGLWELQVDYTGDGNFDNEGTAVDATYVQGSYFGIVCTYTSSRSEAFFLDDISISPIVQDLDCLLYTSPSPRDRG